MLASLLLAASLHSGVALRCYDCIHLSYSSSDNPELAALSQLGAESVNSDICIHDSDSEAEGTFQTAKDNGKMATCSAEVKCGRGHIAFSVNVFGSGLNVDLWASSCINEAENDGKPLGCTSNFDDVNFGNWLGELGYTGGFDGWYCTCDADHCNFGNHGTPAATLAAVTMMMGLLAAYLFN